MLVPSRRFVLLVGRHRRSQTTNILTHSISTLTTEDCSKWSLSRQDVDWFFEVSVESVDNWTTVGSVSITFLDCCLSTSSRSPVVWHSQGYRKQQSHILLEGLQSIRVTTLGKFPKFIDSQSSVTNFRQISTRWYDTFGGWFKASVVVPSTDFFRASVFSTARPTLAFAYTMRNKELLGLTTISTKVSQQQWSQQYIRFKAAVAARLERANLLINELHSSSTSHHPELTEILFIKDIVNGALSSTFFRRLSISNIKVLTISFGCQSSVKVNNTSGVIAETLYPSDPCQRTRRSSSLEPSFTKERWNQNLLVVSIPSVPIHSTRLAITTVHCWNFQRQTFRL